MSTITLRLGDCVEVLAGLADNSVDAAVTDPPYGLEFMGKEWDRLDLKGSASRPNTSETAESRSTRGMGHGLHAGKPAFDLTQSSQRAMQEWHLQWLREVYRVLKPGGVAKVFSATRTFHRLAAAMEEAGFFLDPSHSLEAWAYGCLSEDTEVLTSGGWAPYHRATVGTPVMGFDPETGAFTWQPVEETFEYPYDREAFRIHGDGTDQVVSVEHRCVVERDGQWEFIRSGELEATEVVPCLQVGVHAEEVRSDGMWAFLLEPAAGLQEEALVRTEGSGGGLHRLWDSEVVSRRMVAEGHQAADVLPEVQRGSSGSGLGEARAQRVGCGDPGGPCLCHSEDDRAEEPSLEGRGDVLQEEGQLRPERPDQVPPMPGRAALDGPQGRVCDGAPSVRGSGDGTTVDTAGSGSPRQPQSHGQCPGEPDAVRVEQGPQTVRAPRGTRPHLVRVSARVERIHYTGIVWCVKVPTGAFVVRRKGMVFITGNSGFPKYLNTSKAIDAHLGKEREVVGHRTDGRYRHGFSDQAKQAQGPVTHEYSAGWVGDPSEVTEAATPEAAKFDGWATALKPGWEPFIVGVKRA